jgi:hypothetical protein
VDDIECKSDSEIDEYLDKYGKISLMYFSQKLNMKTIGVKPTFDKNSWFGAYQLYLDRFHYSRTYLQHHDIKVQDALI